MNVKGQKDSYFFKDHFAVHGFEHLRTQVPIPERGKNLHKGKKCYYWNHDKKKTPKVNCNWSPQLNYLQIETCDK